MKKNNIACLVATLILLSSTFVFCVPAFCDNLVIDQICEFGISFYRMGRYDDALAEFKKVLVLNPNNETAKEYIGLIFREDLPVAGEPNKESLLRQESVENVLAEYEAKGSELTASPGAKDLAIGEEPINPDNKKDSNLKIAGINVSGEVQARFGVTPTRYLWKKANFDLNEKNWRFLADSSLLGPDYNRRQNTYDPRIYQRLDLNLDTDNAGDGFNFHSNLRVDPWSFVGKSERVTVANGGDKAEIEFKWWSNTGGTYNETIHTLLRGDSFNLPELSVHNGRVAPLTVATAFGNTFNIPETKINYTFQPVRELWLDYQNSDTKLRFFPFAYEKQALTFDDPLKLSNNHTWWESSPWINRWFPGNYNPAGIPVPDYTVGYWDNSIAFQVRDSEGTRLTGLRGVSFDSALGDNTTINASFASPKDPWQEYTDPDNAISALRIQHSLLPNLDLGFSSTGRAGLDTTQDNRFDALNYVLGTDATFEIIPGLETSLELAHSQSYYNISNSTYKTDSDGYAYYFSLTGRYPFDTSIMNTKYGYDGIQSKEEEDFFHKFRFLASRMDQSFDASLSSYVETRDDEWWSRHLHFRRPFQYYYQDGGLAWEDVKNFAVGNGIDIGRTTLGFRIESSMWDKKADNLFDVRNVHSNKGDFVENVTRDQLTVKLNDKLTAKFLGIHQAMPKTTAGVDPFIFNPRTRQYYLNDQIEGGKDPSTFTGSLGMEYAFFDWLAVNGIWEYTNDYSLAYDNFPRGILNSGNQAYIYTRDGRVYRDSLNWLFAQQLFPKPYYPFYNIFKAGLRLNPTEKLDIYLDYTRNPFAKAGQVDDNMNHVGIECSYMFSKKIGMFFKYTYSRWQDLDRLLSGFTKSIGHHNVFAELMYRKTEDEDLVIQYGEAGRDPYSGGMIDIGWDPYGGSLRTIDTPHIVRLYYRRKF